MPRLFAATLAAVACIVSADAQACLCFFDADASQAEIDAAGERVYAHADLIVDATAGDVSWLHKTLCRNGSLPSRLIGFGQSISSDRPLTVHRILKGRPPSPPVLAGPPTTLQPIGCVVTTSSCDSSFRAGQRDILVLHRLADGHYEPVVGCDVMALRRSRRGQALFKRAG